MYSPPSFLLIRNLEMIFARNIHRSLLRPYLCIRFVTIAITTHFQAQMSPDQVKPPPHFANFHVTTIFLGDLQFQMIFAKNLHGSTLGPYI